MISKENIARVEVQKDLCQKCQSLIKTELQKIENIANVILYPEHALVVFSFFKANELSVALNTLSRLGYPEVGETPSLKSNDNALKCAC